MLAISSVVGDNR